MNPLEKADVALIPWLTRPVMQIVVLVFTVGVAWAALTAEVSNKADRADVTALSALVDTKANRLSMDSLWLTVHDIQITVNSIHRIQCEDHPKDSSCPVVP